MGRYSCDQGDQGDQARQRAKPTPAEVIASIILGTIFTTVPKMTHAISIRKFPFALALCAAAALTACASSQEAMAPSKQAKAPSPASAAVVKAEAGPTQDSSAWVNHDWLAATPIPDDKLAIGEIMGDVSGAEIALRANGVVKNFDEFHQAYQAQPGDKMYLRAGAARADLALIRAFAATAPTVPVAAWCAQPAPGPRRPSPRSSRRARCR
jgi:hypothetical protein